MRVLLLVLIRFNFKKMRAFTTWTVGRCSPSVDWVCLSFRQSVWEELYTNPKMAFGSRFELKADEIVSLQCAFFTF